MDGELDRHPYIEQIKNMKEYEISTLYVSFKHILERDDVLADAIRSHYYRFLTYLRRTVAALVREFAPTYVYVNPNQSITTASGLQAREFSVAFYDLSLVSGIRELRTDKIGHLMSISGTVTRTSEVRPELLYGTFRCEMCNGVVPDVEQQFKYTEVRECFCSVAPMLTLHTAQLVSQPHVRKP